MGRIKNLQIDLMNLEKAWLDFLASLFEQLGYRVKSVNDNLPPSMESDLALEQDDESVLVEYKLYRSERVPLALVRNAFSSLTRMMAGAGARRGILVIPQRLVESHYLEVRQDPAIELWDRDKLVETAVPFPELSAKLADLFRALQIGAEHAPEGSAQIAELGDTIAGLPPEGEGTQIANELASIPAGKAKGSAIEFEKVCERALKLLFGKDLLGWRTQSDIEQGFQRVDVIARLQPSQSAFWSTIAADFRTRYIVFEFKNYTNQISQDQIYSTEKYLFTTALRSVAIIIAKNGMSLSAERAIQGALREQGKLILCLSGAEFGEVLRGFDAGDSPEEILIHKRDDLLMSIAR